jgi:GST-like protein
MTKRLADVEYLAGDYSSADMASIGWARGYERYEIDLAEFPHFKRWLDAVQARPAVQRGFAVKVDREAAFDLSQDKAAQAILFGQRAR